MTAYLVRRLVALLPVMAIVVTIVFLLIHLIPGDPVAVMLGPDATTSQVEETRKALGLDRPLGEQLLLFYARILHGDLGRSYFLDRPVTTALWERAEPTIVLTLLSLLVAVAIGVPSGIVAAAYPGSPWDRLLMLGALLGVCVPGFWLSLNFIYLFAVRLGWLPAAGYASFLEDPAAALRYMVLPATSLGFNQSALIARISRSCMLEVLQQDYVRTARAKGLSQRTVFFRFAWRGAMGPIVTILGLDLGSLLGGAVITEQTFGLHGIGAVSVKAVKDMDLPMLLGVTLVAAGAIVVFNIVVDAVYALIDPRVRLA